MTTPEPSRFVTRRLTTVQAGGVTLLDAVADADPESRRIGLFFAQGTDPAQITPLDDLRVIETRSVGGAPWMICEADHPGPVRMRFGTQEVHFTPAAPELDLLADTHAALAIRNGESAQIVLEWLAFHAEHHGMTAAVILNRAQPGTDPDFTTALEQGLQAIHHPCRVVVLDADVPLGRTDMPPEAHPYCVPEAPGKDRMQVPAPAPWSAPLGEVLSYEIARARFLDRARAVANIDVYDLLAPDGDTTVFEAAVASDSGVLNLVGRHCYPWRMRKDADARFGDHICVQFDAQFAKRRWCIAPAKAPAAAVWRLIRIGNANPDPTRAGLFYRFMALRHPTPSVSKIVPKTSLIEHPPLLKLSQSVFEHSPVRMPQITIEDTDQGRGTAVIVTTMKNEGPFILEWIAYHRAIGFDGFLVYTNDCTDGTDTLLELLQTKGIVQHRDNPFKGTDLKPQHAALEAAEREPLIVDAKWITCMDVDEYVDIKVGNGTLDDLFAHVPQANMIAMTWRLFGNSDIHEFRDGFIIESFSRCAPELIRKPHQAWGFKTLFQNIGLFKKLGVHRPKGLNPQLWDQINWVNGSGKPMPRKVFRNSWRSTVETYGYDLVSLNHYAVRSAESFLVKRDRGRVNHVGRDQGLAYWFRMNNNADQDHSIKRMLPALRAEFETLMADPDIAAAHRHCVAQHRAKIDALRDTKAFADFYAELTSPRMEKLSRMHAHFGANVFLSGPTHIPDEVVARDPDEPFFFTVERGETEH